jgi:flagellar hook-associated protein 1
MSLLGTLGISANALNAASLGLQVTGNNIANANTPDYIRQRLLQSPQLPQQAGGLLIGLGVKVDGVGQIIDKFLQERLRNATSDLAGSVAQESAYAQLESVINELGDNDLSTSLTSFFSSIHDVQNQPESTSVRNIAVQRGRGLADNFRRLDQQVRSLHRDVNQRIISAADDINGLLKDIADLNEQILEAEGGRVLPSDAVGLRDRRGAALAKLAEITDIHTIEQPTGDVTVFSGGEFLVSRGTYRSVTVVTSAEDNLQISEIRVAELDAPLTSGGGRLGGLLEARDTVLAGFLSELDQLSQTLIYEFNKLHSGGQGLAGYTQLTSEHAVSNVTAALDEAGLPFTPSNGLFQVHLYNSQSSQRQTFDIRVDLNGLDTDTNLTDLASQLDAIDGISATLTLEGQLQITSDAPQLSFAFAGDTSGALAAMGINTFFSGTRASNIGVSQDLRTDPKKLAISSGGIGADTQNGELLANLLTAPLASQSGASLAVIYDRLTGSVAQAAQTARGTADGLRSFQQTLEAQHLSVSGVNIDEEAVQMIEYQRAYQAAARVISTINELLDTLLSL